MNLHIEGICGNLQQTTSGIGACELPDGHDGYCVYTPCVIIKPGNASIKQDDTSIKSLEERKIKALEDMALSLKRIADNGDQIPPAFLQNLLDKIRD